MKTTLIILAIPALAILWLAIRSVSVNYRNWNIYEIKKGKHYSKLVSDWWPFDIKFDPLVATSLNFIAVFNKGTYTESEGVNKLYGFGWGIRGPLYNSYRIGWKYNGKNIDVYQFVGDKGKEIFTRIGTANVGEDVIFRITFMPLGLSTVVSGTIASTEYKSTYGYTFNYHVSKLKYRLFPYFGGTDVAPSDVRVMIKETL